MNEKTVKRLFDMEIDEVSMVDRPANQLASIAFSKADDDWQDVDMVFDANGSPVDIDDLDDGDVVYSADGDPFVLVTEDEDEPVAVGKAYAPAEPSLGDLLLEELSKASNDQERSEVMAAAMNEVEFLKAQAEEAWQVADQERDLRQTDEFIAKAASYNLPVDPTVFGPILKAMAETLDDQDLDVLDNLFTAVGEVLFDEIGYAGENDNGSVLDQVNAHASQLIGKADVSSAQAVTEIFEANPDAYDLYLAEGRP